MKKNVFYYEIYQMFNYLKEPSGGWIRFSVKMPYIHNLWDSLSDKDQENLRKLFEDKKYKEINRFLMRFPTPSYSDSCVTLTIYRRDFIFSHKYRPRTMIDSLLNTQSLPAPVSIYVMHNYKFIPSYKQFRIKNVNQFLERAIRKGLYKCVRELKMYMTFWFWLREKEKETTKE